MDTKKFYFAYGSNMSTRRMCERIPEAKAIGIAALGCYQFICNKKSKDGSSKGNIAAQADAHTWGVIFEVPEAAIDVLDKAEGGYQRIQVPISYKGETIVCETYISENTCNEIPFDWYLGYILDGAEEHSLPSDYLQFLSTIPVKKDERKP